MFAIFVAVGVAKSSSFSSIAAGNAMARGVCAFGEGVLPFVRAVSGNNLVCLFLEGAVAVASSEGISGIGAPTPFAKSSTVMSLCCSIHAFAASVPIISLHFL